jgi:hypothetical protein
MRDRAIRTRQAGSVVGSVCAGPSLLATEAPNGFMGTLKIQVNLLEKIFFIIG